MTASVPRPLKLRTGLTVSTLSVTEQPERRAQRLADVLRRVAEHRVDHRVRGADAVESEAHDRVTIAGSRCSAPEGRLPEN